MVSQKSSIDLHHLHELLEIHRLGDVAVGVQVVGLEDVLLGLGGGQDHHRDAPQLGVGLDLRQHLAAVLAGQVQVQQDQVGPRGVGVACPSRRRKSRASTPSSHDAAGGWAPWLP